MSYEAKGALIPVGGGDNIPLIKDRITIGRRESCDVCLRFPNISGQHVELTFEDDCWRVRDLGSTNGIKINGVRVQERGIARTCHRPSSARVRIMASTPSAGRRVSDRL